MSDSSELTDEEGRTYFDINLENVEDQRLAAEEYIAFLAQQEVKPSWWKELLQKIRMAFAKLPYFKDVTMTDKQIGLILARSARKVRKGGAYQAQDGGGKRFSVDGKYFKKWQDVIEQFKKDLEGVELNQEQRDIYDVVLRQKDKIRLRINDLNELEDIFVNFGTRKKGIQKLISVHYAGLRNPVTALEVLNIGDVIRRGELTEEGTADHPTSRRYELKARDGATLKVIIDFNRKKDKNKSVINFYSDRTSDTGAHNVSSGIITDSFNNIQQISENASQTDENGRKRTETDGLRFSVAEYSEDEQRDIVDILKPFTGSIVDKNPEDYAAYLRDHGVDIPDKDAFRFAQEAARQKMKQARKAADKRRDNWLYDNIMEYRWAVEFSGSSDFKLRVSPRFEKDEKSGTFWYNPKKDQGVPVISLEELAKHVARQTGKDEFDVEEDLFNFYKDLTKPILRKNYTEFKAEQHIPKEDGARNLTGSSRQSALLSDCFQSKSGR